MVSMKDFWKTAPSGGEFTSSFSMEEMMDTDLSETVEMIREAHTTFLGPKIPDEDYAEGYKRSPQKHGVSSVDFKVRTKKHPKQQQSEAYLGKFRSGTTI